MRREYDGLTAGAVPNPGLLGFVANSVIINSGNNFVRSAANLWPLVPPNVSGFQIPLSQSTQIADFLITAPPAGPQPLGPPIFTSIIYTDERLPYSAGVLSQPNTIVTLSEEQTVINPVNSLYELGIGSGLARAITFFGLTLDTLAHNWGVLGFMPASGAAPVILATSGGSPSAGFEGGFGQGTLSTNAFWIPGYPNTAATVHLFSSYTFQCSAPFCLDVRMYF